MDAVDKAQAREDELRDEAIASARNRPREAPRTVGGVRLCLDCDDPINEQRLAANPQAVRCAECQEKHEHQQGRARGWR